MGDILHADFGGSVDIKQQKPSMGIVHAKVYGAGDMEFDVGDIVEGMPCTVIEQSARAGVVWSSAATVTLVKHDCSREPKTGVKVRFGGPVFTTPAIAADEEMWFSRRANGHMYGPGGSVSRMYLLLGDRNAWMSKRDGG